MANIVVTGGSGFLGSKIIKVLSKSNKVIGTSSRQGNGFVAMDISNRDNTVNVIKECYPDFIIHTAAYSNADDCEKNPTKAYEINTEGTRNIAIAAAKIGSTLFYTSSVYIFDGEKGNYTELDEPSPINILGKTKLEGEKAIKENLSSYVMIRFPISYGYNGKRESNAFFGQIIKGEPMKVNDDELRQPLIIDDLAEVIKGFIEDGITGVFNLAGPQEMTKYQLGVQLEKLVRSESVLTPVTCEHHYASRPKYATLNTEKIKGMGIRIRSLDKGIELIRQQLIM